MAAAAETEMKECNRCKLKQSKLRRCSKCKNVWYCGLDCQKRDWVQGHRLTCGSGPPAKSEVEEPLSTDQIKVAHGLLTAQQIKVSNSRTGFVKFPLPAEGQTLLKKAAEEGVEIETKASQVFVDVITKCEENPSVDVVMKQIESLQLKGRYRELLDGAVDYEAVVRFHFDVLLQQEEEEAEGRRSIAECLQCEAKLNALASMCVRIYVYLSSLPHTIRDFDMSLTFIKKGKDFCRFLLDSYPDTQTNVAPVMKQLQRLHDTTVKCLGCTTAGEAPESDDDFAKLVGTGDSLTLDERIEKAVRSEDVDQILRSHRQAWAYGVGCPGGWGAAAGRPPCM